MADTGLLKFTFLIEVLFLSLAAYAAHGSPQTEELAWLLGCLLEELGY